MTATEELASGTLQVTRAGRICYVVLNRPDALNALTLPMYDALSELCQRLNNEPTVRVVVFRGAGGRALAAGTDIAEFTDFTSGEDGVRYERRIGVALQAIEDVPQVTIAEIQGVAVGGKAWPWRPPATFGWELKARGSVTRSRARWATRSRYRLCGDAFRCSARR